MKILGLRGWSGSGKTTLLVNLIPELTRRRLRVSTVKHAHHGFDLDRPGKDSFRHREAGATEGAGEDADEGEADLDGGQEALGVFGEQAGAAGAAETLGFQDGEAVSVGGDERHFAQREQAVERDQQEDDDDVDGGVHWADSIQETGVWPNAGNWEAGGWVGRCRKKYY